MNYTPAQARELADDIEHCRPVYDISDALRSLADQVEALTAERDALQADAARLDFLQSKGSCVMGWTCRKSTTGRGYRLHQTTDSTSATPRAAIDAAMKEPK